MIPFGKTERLWKPNAAGTAVLRGIWAFAESLWQGRRYPPGEQIKAEEKESCPWQQQGQRMI